MPTDYVQMLLAESLASSKDDTKIMVESIEYELEYIASCIENNHIMPVTEAKKNGGGVFQKFIDLIRNIFSKFKEKVNKITLDLKDWDDVIDKLENANFSGITIESTPQWNVSGDEIAQHIDRLVAGFKQTTTSNPSDSDDVTPEGVVKSMSVFRQFRDDKVGYKKAMERVFSVGKNTAVISQKINITSRPTIQEVCDIGSKYIKDYKNLSNRLSQLAENIQATLSNAERGIEATNESYNPYLILEGACLSNTNLILCNNGDILFEADDAQDNQNQQTDNNTDKDKPENMNPAVKTTVSNDGGDKGSPKNLKLELQKSYAKVLVDAVSVAITVAERKLYVYKSIINSVVKNSEKGAPKKKANSDIDNTSEGKKRKLLPPKKKK